MDTDAELRLNRATLGRVDLDLLRGEARIHRQQELVDDLRTGGRDAREAERFLAALHRTLVGWQGHRALIARRIAYLGARPGPSARPGPG